MWATGDKIIAKAYFKVNWLISLRCEVYIICFFLQFKDKWFALNHLFKVMKTMSMFLFKSGMSVWVNKILVSSAKIIGDEVVFIILGKSFIYNKKRRGPKIEPWGTPCLILAQFETIFLFTLLLYNAVLQYLLFK